jgi:hypothetical protein
MASTSLKQLVGFARTARVRSTLNRLTRGRVGLYSTAEHYSDGPHAKVLRYYQYDSAKQLACQGCGWVGDGDSATTNHFAELFDVCCPRCDRMLLVIGYPTFGEIEEAARRGHPEAQRELELIRERDTGP